jgi:hypothetical protein
MAGDPFTKTSPGSPLVIPAVAYNAFIDAANALQNSSRVGTPGSQGAPLTEIVRCVNRTGANVLMYGVVGIGNPATTFSANAAEQAIFLQNPRVFEAELPTSTNHADRFGIVLSCVSGPSNANGAGFDCALRGVYPCRVDVTDEAHEFAGVKGGSSEMLASADSGLAQILWKEAGTGTKWAIIKFPFGGGGGGSFSVVQATADGVGGVVTAKAIQFKANVASSPNFTLAATAVNLNYYKL